MREEYRQHYGWLMRYHRPAESVSDFLRKYYRRNRIRDFSALVDSYEREYEEFGYCFIATPDNVVGEIAAWYGPNFVVHEELCKMEGETWREYRERLLDGHGIELDRLYDVVNAK